MQAFLTESGGRYPKRSIRSKRGLHAWAKNQRSAHVGTGDTQMADAKAARLEGLPGWQWTVNRSTGPWERSTSRLALQAFPDGSGGRYPSQGPSEKALNKWVAT